MLAVSVLVLTFGTPGVRASTATLFTDGFESGDLSAWTVTTSATGTAQVQSSVTQSGTYAARLTAGSKRGAAAYLRAGVTPAPTDVTAEASFRMASAGSKDLPLVRLIDRDGILRASVLRRADGRVLAQHNGVTLATTAVAAIGSWMRVTLHVIVSGSASSVEVLVDGASSYRSSSADLGVTPISKLQVGSDTKNAEFDAAIDDVSVVGGDAPPPPTPTPTPTPSPSPSPSGTQPPSGKRLLIAENLGRRLLITTFDGTIVWKMDNPTGRSDPYAGPLGVRWLPGNKILATFGTGEVGVIDVATKTWDWKTTGFNQDWFQSPYDADLTPDGKLIVATRYNEGGRVTVYDRATGQQIWKHLVSNAHSAEYRTAAQSFNSDEPTIMVGGWGGIREVVYKPGSSATTAWSATTEYTHDILVLSDDRVLTSEGYYIQKIDRAGNQLWRRSTPDENRRIAINPDGGLIYTVGNGDRVEFRDDAGVLLNQWSRLSDGSTINYPYGIRVIEYP